MAKTPRIPIPQSVREYIFQRDNYHCKSCGVKNNLTVDHIIPLAQGGSNDISNLQTLCRQCNSKKKHHFDPRFKRYFE